MVVIDHRGEKTQGRIIHPAEEWLLNGGRVEELRLLKGNGTNEEELRRDAMRKCPQQTCHRALAWLERWRQNPNLAQRVVCKDRDRAAADAQVRAWMLAWKGNREHPQREYERWLKDRVGDCERVGGRPRGSKNRSKSAPPETLVHPVAIGRSRERICLDANRDLEKDIAWLDALAAEAVMSKLSEGTRAAYEIGWKQWCLWRRLEKKDIYLVGEGKEARKQDEDELLRFMTYLAHVMKRTEGTIKQRLFAIKMGHLVAGHEDPTLHRTRIWAALNGFKRWQPDTNRKYPVLPNMLRWMKRHLAENGSYDRANGVIMWAVVMTGFFFLLRASEFLVSAGRSWGTTRVLKGSNVEGRKDNKQVATLHHAEEVVIYLSGSKTDQFNQGAVRNQFRSGSDLCVVSALAAYQALCPERFAGAESEMPLFRYMDGRPIPRTDLQSLIQLAAVADGQASTRYGSHSLRIGGATALYQSTHDLEVVKRFGRWNSEAFHAYLWETHEKQKNLAKGVAKADGQLLPPRKEKMAFEEHSRKGKSNVEHKKETNEENTFDLGNHAQKLETKPQAIKMRTRPQSTGCTTRVAHPRQKEVSL